MIDFKNTVQDANKEYCAGRCLLKLETEVNE